MTNHENLWTYMGVSSQRRVVADSPHDVFWITDHLGRYGFLIVTKESELNAENGLSLKGITLIRRTGERGFNEFFLVLNNRDDWSIFSILCKDLTDVIVRYNDHKKMINGVENQLMRWQRLLQHDPSPFAVEQQMGLFSELMCLKEIVIAKSHSVADAIKSWRGPDFDNQDFLMSNAVIEVKSHRTSKGENVSISSAQQLYCDKEPFFLVSYALTPTELGLSVADLSSDIMQLCASEESKGLFESKTLQYGYVPEFLNEPLQKFIVDYVKVFRVTAEFPKIVPTNLKSQVSSVKYKIDLSQCSEYERKYNEFMKEV